MDYLRKREFNFWLGIISPLLSIAVAWGAYASTITHQQEQIDEIKSTIAQHRADSNKKFEEMDSTYTDIKIQLAEIQRDILYIKERMR